MKADMIDTAPEGPVEQASAWCLRLAEGSLSRDEQARFDAWLEADEAHREAFDDNVRAWRALEHSATTPELVDMRTAALATFRRAQRARWAPRFARSPWSIAAALVVALGLALAAGLWVAHTPRAYETAVAERRVVVLADGSKVSLDAATKVEVRYMPGRRELRLDYGRAKFTVAKNPARPFTVAAADKVVLATGTEFSVELVHDRVQVILYQGHVAVLAQADTPTPRRVALTGGGVADQRLTPGEALTAPLTGDAAEVEPVDPVRTLSWEGGQLVFVDEPLSLAVERVNRYAVDKLRVGDAAAGDVRISGNFTAGDTAAFVEGITGVFPVQARDENGHEVLVSKGG